MTSVTDDKARSNGDGKSISNNNTTGSNALVSSLRELSQKVESSLSETIQNYNKGSTHQYGLDFLQCKNSVLLSYLIDLTYHLRQQLTPSSSSSTNNETDNWDRLMEMKTIIDKMLGLDKKLRYQIDKLLAAAAEHKTFAIAAEGASSNNNEDPLHFRPNLDALDDDDDNSSSSSSSDDGDSDEEGQKKEQNRVDDSDGGSDDDENDDDDDDDDASNKHDSDDDDGDIDDDLAAARQTLAMAKVSKSNKKSSVTKKKKKKSNDDDGDDDEDDVQQNDDDGIYRAPRLQAVPYEHDIEDKNKNKMKRFKKNLRASEIAQTIRGEYTDMPETDDIHGGTQIGHQNAEARRIAQKQAEKTKFEEENMIRLTTTRLEKKERNRMMRQETSNLRAITDLGNLVRETAYFNNDESKSNKSKKNKNQPTPDTERYSNGTRKKQRMDRDGRVIDETDSARHKPMKMKNQLQAALYGSAGGKNSKKKKSSKR